jgi:hypothetical protein
VFFFVTQVGDEWTLGTRAGHLVTCDESLLPEGAPRLIVHPRCSVPTMPLLAKECAHCRPQPVHDDDVPEGHVDDVGCFCGVDLGPGGKILHRLRPGMG